MPNLRLREPTNNIAFKINVHSDKTWKSYKRHIVPRILKNTGKGSKKGFNLTHIFVFTCLNYNPKTTVL